jgi:ABC-type phosphate transport system substrate-binding protein
MPHGHIKLRVLSCGDRVLLTAVTPNAHKLTLHRCDLKAIYKGEFGKVSNLRGTLEQAGIQFEGRCHSGLDDAFNTAKLAVQLARQRGIVFTTTNSFGNCNAADATRPSSGKAKQGALQGFGTPRAAKKPQVRCI